MNEVAQVVCEVYAAGAKLLVLDGGIGVDGEIPGELKSNVRGHREGLLEALQGDPLQGLGWEARVALHRQALRWLEEQIEKPGPGSTFRERAATETLCRRGVADRLNAAWCDGDFGEFRAALREYVKAGLDASKSKRPGRR